MPRKRTGRRCGFSPAAIVLLQATRLSMAQPCVSWSQVSNSGPSVREAAMVYDVTRARIVLYGGLGNGTPQDDTWEWDGAIWISRATIGPPARAIHAMAYDSGRNRTVLFGGYSYGGVPLHLGDTWEWDGGGWTQRASGGPSPRYDHAMAYDASHARVVLFGGTQGGTPFGDTWQWDGLSWSLAATTGPAPREGAAMAYDLRRNRMVLFGGNSVPAVMSDTWEWDGATWTHVASSGPSPRSGASLAFDNARAKMVLFGGWPGPVTDMWEWDGASWTQRLTSGPAGGYREAMAYDLIRDRVVLHIFYSDTWELQRAPTILLQPVPTSVPAGTSVTLSVSVSAAASVSYLWRRNGVPLSDGNRITGTTTSTLNLVPAFQQDAGAYDVVISSGCDAVTSLPAQLTVQTCRSDWNGNGEITPADVAGFVTDWFASLSTGTLAGDFDRNLVVQPSDVGAFVNAWIASLTGNCPP